MADKIDRDRMAANYGFALAFMKSDKELWALFNKAVKNTWAPDMFVAKMRNTKWFQTHSANVRNAILQETSDPATYKAAVNQMHATVRDSWGALYGKQVMDNKDLRTWAETAHRMGWSEAQLLDKMSASVNYRKMLKRGQLGGQAADLKTQLDVLSQQYGVQLGRNYKANAMARVMRGDETAEGIRHKVAKMAMQEYKAFADRIKGGETIMDVAEPYMQRYADLLEMNPEDVNLYDGLMQKALKQQDKNGKPAAMDLYTFEKEVRRDKRWQYTRNAREEVSSLTGDLLRSFGVVA